MSPQIYTSALMIKLACNILSILIFYRGGINSSCAKGYKGIICSQCIGYDNTTKELYAKSYGTKCLKCKSTNA